ncbi:MAG: hypothetical protein ABJ360_09645 [Roseobacter sp.]
METIQLNSALLKYEIRIRFKSVDGLIKQSNGFLTQKNRSAIYRAYDGRLIEMALAETISELLQVPLRKLSAQKFVCLRLTPESDALIAALNLLRTYWQSANQSEAKRPSKPVCVSNWLRDRLRLDDDLFDSVHNELVRIGHLRKLESGVWGHYEPSYQEIIRLLRGRISFQWPLMHAAFSQSRSRRKVLAVKLNELIQEAETKLVDPVQFFSTDDQIHELFCSQPLEVDLLHACRSVSWNIAHHLIGDLASQFATDPHGAAASMQFIGKGMLEDYRRWSVALSDSSVVLVPLIRKRFRRHVLEMLDHAVYYRDPAQDQGSGKLIPGSSSTCLSTSILRSSGESVNSDIDDNSAAAYIA